MPVRLRPNSFSSSGKVSHCHQIFQNGKALGADFVHYVSQLLDLFSEPGLFICCYVVVFGITGLDVGFLQLLEHRALFLMVGRPHVGEVMINPLGLSAQKAEIVHIRRVERHNKQDAVE